MEEIIISNNIFSTGETLFHYDMDFPISPCFEELKEAIDNGYRHANDEYIEEGETEGDTLLFYTCLDHCKNDYDCGLNDCDCDCVEMTKLLIESGADVNKVDNMGLTPIFLACSDVCKVLIDNGAKINIKSNTFTGSPLFTQSCINENDDNIKRCNLMIMNGIDLEITNDIGMTALQFYIAFDRTKEAKLLLECGADTSNVLFNSCTSMNMFKVLLDYGIDVNKTDDYGETVLFNCPFDYAELYIKNGCNVNHMNNNGESAIFGCPCPEKIGILLNNGATVSYKNNDGIKMVDSNKMYPHEDTFFHEIRGYEGYILNVRKEIVVKHISSMKIASFFMIISSKKEANRLRSIPQNLFNPEFINMRFKIMNVSKEWSR